MILGRYLFSLLFITVLVPLVCANVVQNTARANPASYFSRTAVASADACDQLCALQTKCVTWVYAGGYCNLKATLDAPYILQNSASGTKAGMFVGDWGMDRAGSTISSVVLAANSSALQCLNLCNASPSCKSWSYQLVTVTGNSTVCNLKNAVPAQSANASLISGVRASQYGRCPSAGSNWVKWSTYFNGTVKENSTVVLSDLNIIMDVSPAIMYNLTILSGGLYFDPSFSPIPASPVLSLKAYNIYVGMNGSLVVGCSSMKWNKPGEIVLYGRRSMYDDAVLVPTPGRKVLAVQAGGALQFYSQTDGPSWTKLGATAMPGTNQIFLTDVVTWTVGQRIVIASSDENPLNTETATIQYVYPDHRTFNLSANLKYKHWGQLWQQNGDAVDIRAEVGLLSRWLVVTSDARNDSDSNITGTRFGGHIMMLPGSNAQLYGAEVTLMGQASFMARYPVHFHINGDTSYGSIVEKLAIHDNYQRSLTIHYSNGIKVNDVVAYNTFGHMYFFEDGVEQYNVMTHNLGLLPQAPRDYDRLMITDSTPAVFWITSPPNSWYNNSAVGGQFGYWFSLPATSIGVANLTFFNISAFPQQSAIIAFEGNSAHSNSKFGLNIDDGITANPPCPYLPLGNADPGCGATARFVWNSRDIIIPMTTTPDKALTILQNAPYKLSTFKNNTFWKSPGHCFWTRGNYHVVQNLMLADCAIAAKHPDGPGVVQQNCVYVGRTENSQRATTYGYTAYDAGGPNFAVGNRYYNYNGTNGAISGQSPHVRIGWDVHLQSQFFNSPNFYQPGAASYSGPDMILEDFDGSLTGHCGSVIVRGSHLVTNDCYNTSGGYGMACPASPPRRRFYMTPYLTPGLNATLNPLRVVRIDSYGEENRTSEFPTSNGVPTSYQNYYEFSVVSTGTYWVGVPGDPSPMTNPITISGMPSGVDYLNKTTPREYVRVIWNYPAGSTFIIYDNTYPLVNYTQVSSKSQLGVRTFYFDSANEWLYVHFQPVVGDTYLMYQNYSMVNTQWNIMLKASCPDNDCSVANPTKMPAQGSEPAPNGPRLRCGYKPQVSFAYTSPSTLVIAANGTFNANFKTPLNSSFVSDPYKVYSQGVLLVNLTSTQIFAAYKYNVSIAPYNYLHFSIALKGAGERGLNVLLSQGSNSSTRVSIANPWYLQGGLLPSDYTKWVEVFIPISRFERIDPTGNISSIQFSYDNNKNNYVAYLNNVYFANVKATGSGF